MHIRNDVHCTGCVHMFSIGRCQAYGYVQPMLFSLFPRADPVSGGHGSADPSLPPAGPLSQDVVSRSADMTLYVVFLPVFPSQSSAAEKIASLIH